MHAPTLMGHSVREYQGWDQTCARGPSRAPAAASSSGVAFLAASVLSSVVSFFLAFLSSRFSLVLFFLPAHTVTCSLSARSLPGSRACGR